MNEDIDPKEMEELLGEEAGAEAEAEDQAEAQNGNGKRTLPESPASLNVKFWADGFGVMLTMRAETVREVLDQFRVILPFIKNAGYKNVWDKEPVTRVLGGEMPPPTQAPVCGIHGNLMEWKTGVSKSSGKPYAFWACPTKNADNSWCNFQAKK